MNKENHDETNYVFDREGIDEICPMFDEILQFFDSKTKGERLPRRSDFEPADLVKYLPYTSLLEIKLDEKDNVEDMFCRVCGSMSATLYGEITGTWLSDLKYPEIFLRVKDRCQTLLEKRQPYAVTTQVLSKEKDHIILRVLYIPLSNDNKTIDKLLTFIEFDVEQDSLEIAI